MNIPKDSKRFYYFPSQKKYFFGKKKKSFFVENFKQFLKIIQTFSVEATKVLQYFCCSHFVYPEYKVLFQFNIFNAKMWSIVVVKL